MHIYSKATKKCYFSISQRILIPFVLSDRAWWGLRNFYTELWNSLIMQMYANLFKINDKCRLSSIQKSQQICTWGGDVYYASRNLLFTCFLFGMGGGIKWLFTRSLNRSDTPVCQAYQHCAPYMRLVPFLNPNHLSYPVWPWSHLFFSYQPPFIPCGQSTTGSQAGVNFHPVNHSCLWPCTQFTPSLYHYQSLIVPLFVKRK